jgi:hypothetical protein
MRDVGICWLLGGRAEHVLGDPIPGRYPWSKTYVCSCGARLLSPEVAQIHIKNFNKASDSTG